MAQPVIYLIFICFDANGTAVSDEILVNTSTDNSKRSHPLRLLETEPSSLPWKVIILALEEVLKLQLRHAHRRRHCSQRAVASCKWQWVGLSGASPQLGTKPQISMQKSSIST